MMNNNYCFGCAHSDNACMNVVAELIITQVYSVSISYVGIATLMQLQERIQNTYVVDISTTDFFP